MERHNNNFDANLEVNSAQTGDDDANGGRSEVVCESELILACSIQDMKRLTPREWEILELLDMGKERQEIQAALHISKGTACTHLRSICSKLGVTDYKHAPLAIRRLGLVAVT